MTEKDSNKKTRVRAKKSKIAELKEFSNLGLSENVLKGVAKCGYHRPTAIQKKTVPVIMQGRDCVAMARTGSGKTACFLLPLFEKLKCRNPSGGARALILSPTRELALQTLRFFKQLGSFVGLQAAAVLGGDSIEDQFSVLHCNPDVIIATLGRFLHICVEMNLKLNNIGFVVFDEADRLFEMGFKDQLQEILSRLPESRQTVLFSATLPKMLVEFTKAGLKNPLLVRMDVDTKIPSELQSYFIRCRPDDKLANFLTLIRDHIPSDQLTIVFVATRYHVDYLHAILNEMNIKNTYIYSSLDPQARRQNTADFNSGACPLLIVTDVAARGIDIPQLDNVINYNFPDKPKLYVHRVGRCARAGRTGTSYSFISLDEYAYVLDLFLFLGRTVTFVPSMPVILKQEKIESSEAAVVVKDDNSDNIDACAIGKLPQNAIEMHQNQLNDLHTKCTEIADLKPVVEKAYTKYLKMRCLASVESNRRVKLLPFESCGIHKRFLIACSNNGTDSKMEIENGALDAFRSQLKSLRPRGTIFEIFSKTNTPEYMIMKQKRREDEEKIRKFHAKNSEAEEASDETKRMEFAQEDFKKVIKIKKAKPAKPENTVFVPYQSKDKFTESGLSVVSEFDRAASSACLDLLADDEKGLRSLKNQKVWDRKRKRMVQVNGEPKTKKIRTEGGNFIDASYKSDKYKKWLDATKQNASAVGADNVDPDDNNDEIFKHQRVSHFIRHNRKMQNRAGAAENANETGKKGSKPRSELKTPEQIVKKRLQDESLRRKNSRKKGRKGKSKRHSGGPKNRRK